MELNLEKCPLCGTELSAIKLREIETKLRQEEQRKTTELAAARLSVRQELEQEFKRDLEKQRRAAEQKAKADVDEQIKKDAAERTKLQKKLEEAEQREAEIVKQSQEQLQKQKLAIEKQAREEVGSALKKITLERDQTVKKLKESEAREAAVRKQVSQEADKQRITELAEQRQALERDKNMALLKQQSEFNRERESLQKKLQKKTANELGDVGEIDIYESLREMFRDDHTVRIKKGEQGADILHEVRYKGEVCGKVIIDSKNRQRWAHEYVTKLRQDQTDADAEHAILASSAFPAGKSGMCNQSGVIVVSPAYVVHVVEILRKAMVAMHIRGLSIKERTTKMTKLYALITSDLYSGKLTEANKLTQDILDLEVQEQTAHSNVWKKRGAFLKRIHNVLRDAETEVAAIIEADDSPTGPPAFAVKGVRHAPTGPRQETV